MEADEIRGLVLEQARLPQNSGSISDTTDLNAAGLTSLARINVIIAVEDRYQIRFEDELLTRDNFKNIQSIYQLVQRVLSKGELLAAWLASVVGQEILTDMIPFTT